MIRGIIFDAQIHRLRHLQHAMRASLTPESRSAPPLELERSAADLPEDEPSLVAALVIRRVRRNGRSIDVLPPILQQALSDLAAEGDPTVRLLYAWLDSPMETDKDVLEAARQPSCRRTPPSASSRWSGERIFRHQRFWRPGSPSLAEANQRRIGRLRKMLAKEISHDQ